MTIETHQAHTVAPLRDRLNYATALAEAGLLPDAFRRQPANVLVGMELAAALDLAPIVVINELSVIGGRPSFSAKFMRSLVRRAGHRLRESITDGTARCVIVRADDPEFEHVAVWDRAKAEKHSYWGKGHWAKNPELMLANRALSECVRSACPEVLGGVAYTPDEVEDFAPARQQRSTAAPVQKLSVDVIRNAAAPEPEAPAAALTEGSPEVVDRPGADDPEGITDAQTRKMGAQMRKVGLTDRAESLAFVARVLGREVASRSDLTKAEASDVIEALTLWETDGADPTTGVVADDGVVEAEVVEGDMNDPWAVQP